MSSDTFHPKVTRLAGAEVDLTIDTSTAGGPNDYACTRSFALLCLVDLLRDNQRTGPLTEAAATWEDGWFVSERFMRREAPKILSGTRILSRELAKGSRPHRLVLRITATDPRWLGGLEVGLATGTTAYDVWWEDPTRPEPPPPGVDGALPPLAAELRHPFHKASNAARVQRVRALLADGADPNEATTGACPPGGCLPLLSALAMAGNDTLYARLVEAGARLDAVDPHDGRTPLHEAAARGNNLLLKAALDAGVLPDPVDQLGRTPLHDMLCSRFTVKPPMLKLLLDAGASVEHRDGEGRTATAHAARNQALAVVKLVVKAGGRVDAVDAEGLTLVHHAACGPRSTSMVRCDEGETLAWLVDKQGLAADARDGSGRTALHHAAANGRARAARWLLERGLDPAATDHAGHTALEVATRKDMRSLLERHGGAG